MRAVSLQQAGSHVVNDQASRSEHPLSTLQSVGTKSNDTDQCTRAYSLQPVTNFSSKTMTKSYVTVHQHHNTRIKHSYFTHTHTFSYHRKNTNKFPYLKCLITLFNTYLKNSYEFSHTDSGLLECDAASQGQFIRNVR